MKRLIPLTLALAFTLTGCKALSEFLRDAFQRPTLDFKNLRLDDISLNGLTLDTVWNLNNPNAVGISLAEVDYALFIEDKQVVAGSPQKGLQIAPNGTSELHFPANLKFQDVAGVVQTFLQKDFARYRAEGALGVQTPIGILKFPIAKDGEFEVPKLPAVAFGNPRITNLSLAGATLEFPLNVTNKNTYPLPIAGVAGNLTLAGAPIGTLSTGNLGAMGGKATKQLSLPLTVNFMQAGMAVANAVQRGNGQLQFNAQVQSGGASVPLRVDQLVNFVR